MTEPDQSTPAAADGGKVYHLSGDFRGAIVNVESTFVNSAVARDIEQLPPEPGDPPYRGLHYFDEADADHFLGREALTARLAGRLRAERFLAVIGASGSGKSSVVRAGLLPALRRGQQLADGALPPDGSDRWLIRVMTPTAHPLDALAAALLPGTESAAVSELRDKLAAAPDTLAAFAAPALGPAHPRLLLVVDQFEELFTLSRHEEERRAFINNLVTAVTGDAPVLVVIVLRADFYAHCAQYDGLRELVSHQQEYIGAMSREELFRVIVLPAARAEWQIQEGLVEQMLDDVGDEPGALPLLSHALLETWQRRRGRTMTLSGYREAGGVHGAIAKTAETVFRRRLSPEQQPIARMIFVRLTELGESADGETPDTRRRAQFDELITRATDAPMLEAVLSILVDSRLVMTDIIPPAETKVVEVAHEALIREWPTLRDWLNAGRAGLIRHRRLTADVNDWLALGRDPGALYRGARLEQTLAWTASPPDPLSVVEQEFLDASRTAAGEEARRAQRLSSATRNQRILIGVAAVLLIGAILVVLNSLNVFDPPPQAITSGDFGIAVAEFAVLDEAGQLTNDDHEGGRRIAERIGASLAGELPENVTVWYEGDGQEHVPIGVVGEELPGAADPAARADELNADMIIYGEARPNDSGADLRLRFHLRPQYGADFSQMVGNYEFKTPIAVFDPADPAEEVWRRLDPLANALAWVTLGLRQEILGEEDEALRAFEQAATFAPDSDVIRFFLGQAHFYASLRGGADAAGRQAAAEAAFAESLRLNPDNPRARIGRGSVHFAKAQRQLLDAIPLPEGDGKTAALAVAEQEARAALAAYTEVAAGPERIETYGVPVAGIARLGQAISLRLLGEVAFRRGDVAAETLIDEAIATLEDEITQLDTANDPRLAAQTYQALGSFYEWKAFLLNERGAAEAAADAARTALAYYNDCVQQGRDFPVDVYLVDFIVGQLCQPKVEELQGTEEGT